MPENFKNVSISDDRFNELFEFIKHDIIFLRSQWRIYRALFGTNQERYDLLRAISYLTSKTLEKTLFEATLLGIRRLTDKPEDRTRKNVSIKALEPYFEEIEKEQLSKLVEEACGKSEFAISWSNKKIAHSDLEHRSGGVVLLPASRAAVEEAIDAIANVVKWVAIKRYDTTLITHAVTSIDDEVSFLQHLFEGQRVIAQKELLSRELTYRGDYEGRNRLYQYPDWLSREEQVLDL